MAKKKTVEEKIDELAIAVGNGFAATASRDEVQLIRDEVRGGFAGVTERLDKIEFLVSGQERRISILEDRLRLISTKIGL